MSVEHPTCPYCDEPLERAVESDFAGLKPCTNSKCPGKESNIEHLDSAGDARGKQIDPRKTKSESPR
jgi:hypothetical protein